MSTKVRITVETVMQPPIDTRASIYHRDCIVESDELAQLLKPSTYELSRVISAVVQLEDKQP